MTKSIISEFLKGTVAYKPVVAKAFGSVKLGLLWCQLYYWRDKGKDPDGWIYKSREEIFEETALGRKEQETARKLGEKIGVLECQRMGEKGVMHFRIDEHQAHLLIEKWVESNGSEEPKEKPKKVKGVLDLKVSVVPSVEMPPWLNPKAWLYWCEYRKEIKKPMTPRAMTLQIKMLEKYKEDHVEMIKVAIISGWQGLWPLKKNKNLSGGYSNSRQGDLARAHEKNMEAEQERRESDENSKNNDRLREIQDQIKKIGLDKKI